MVPDSWVNTNVEGCKVTSLDYYPSWCYTTSGTCGTIVIDEEYCTANDITPCTYLNYEGGIIDQEIQLVIEINRGAITDQVGPITLTIG